MPKTPRRLPAKKTAPSTSSPRATATTTIDQTPRGLVDGQLAFVPDAWRFILFTDLHVSAKTLDRALALLDYVRECAVANSAHVVCLGDFWDQRASLAVRQLDAVQREFERWARDGVHLVLIPGNHDQVSRDGAINAVRIFDAYSHVHVVSAPMYDARLRCAFVPWREEDGEQQRAMDALPEGTTAFVHAEIAGARSNGGHRASGRVSVAACDRMRAVYAGHYHARQKLGEHAWYIGSPFEMNFGEREEPHGIALVTHDEAEPAFLDLDAFPKHYRFEWPRDEAKLAKAREHDIVELVMPESDLAGPALRKALASVRAADVRPVPAPKSEASTAASVALSLDAAIEPYVDAHLASIDAYDTARRSRLIAALRGALSNVGDARAVAPFAPKTRMVSVRIEGFCAIRDALDVNLDAIGATLLRGSMGVGKTSICDAITWALYGTTTPRKPGATGGALRADDVVHDAADEARVSVTLDAVAADGTRHRVIVTRAKKRGAGARLRVVGPEPEGASTDEQQALVHRLVGLDIDLWRACVYLGQGAVANFVTDADKRRKDLLARAFGLAACEPALKSTREHAKRAAGDVSLYKLRLAEARAGLDALASADFTAQVEAWDAERAAHCDALRAQAHEAQAHADGIEPHLAAEAEWLDRQRQYDAHLSTLARSLVASTSDRATKLASDLGAVQAERSLVDREIAKANAEYTKLMTSRAAGAAACTSCGQALPVESVDAHLAMHEETIGKLRLTAGTLGARASNLANELEGARSGDSSQKEALRTQMDEARTALAKINEAISAISRMRQTRDEHLRRASEVRTTLARREAESNPFAAKQREADARRAALAAAQAEAETKLADAEQRTADLAVLEDAFSPKGLPVLVLRSALHELETHANTYLARLLAGRVMCRVSLDDDDLILRFFEWNGSTHVERSYLQLSGGQRRCVELAFSPFALAEMIYARVGTRCSFLVVDELTTHLDPDTKPIVCALLQSLDRETVLVIDHDQGVHGEFDRVLEVARDLEGRVALSKGGA